MLTSNPPALPFPDSLRAAGAAVVLASGFVLAALGSALSTERQYLPAITPAISNSLLTPADREELEEANHPKRQPREVIERLKNQGLALQKGALEQPDLLPLYGSSELLKGIDDKASIFFRHYPTGFAVFPIGRPGSTCLILAQKIGSLGLPPPSRKIAISISPSWFYGGIDPKAYAGNFSPQQALALALNPHLSFALKSELARRMEEYPETLRGHALLRFVLERLDRGTPVNRLLYDLAWPAGWLQETCEGLQDHMETAATIRRGLDLWATPPEHRPEQIDWPRLLEEEAKLSHPFQVKANQTFQISGSAGYIGALRYNTEWTDLDLMLRMLRELHYDPLLLSMPSNGTFLEEQGISRQALAAYPRRLHVIAERFGDTARTFTDHLDDPNFVVDFHDHLSVKGWMYYNRALDEFFHAPPEHP